MAGAALLTAAEAVEAEVGVVEEEEVGVAAVSMLRA
jgi:hypothetical protein